jgi:hypothetical protein
VAAVAHLLLFGVQPQVRVGALQRALTERRHLLVQAPAQPGDLVLGHPHPELLDHAVDLPGRDAIDVGLLDDRHQRLLGAPARLQKRREIRRARAQPGDRQLELADARLPRPLAVTVALRRAPLRHALAELGADHLRDLGLHQLSHHQPHRLPDHIGMLRQQQLVDHLRSGHPPALGHRGVLPSTDCSNSPTIRCPRWPPSSPRRHQRDSYTTSTDSTTNRTRLTAHPDDSQLPRPLA